MHEWLKAPTPLFSGCATWNRRSSAPAGVPPRVADTRRRNRRTWSRGPPLFRSTASVGGPREGQCRSTASLSPPRCPPRHLLPAWAKTSSLVREIRHPRPRSLPVLEVALLIIGASISVAALAWPGNGVSAALLGGIVVVCPRILSAIMTSPLHHHAPRKLSATSDECPVAALILTSFSRSSGRFAVVGSLTGPR
jgi:hypothetical protein